MRNDGTFDNYAENYDAALSRGLTVSGEDKSYFCFRRIEWLANCLSEIRSKPTTVMDFGCGTGAAAAYLLDILGAESVVGVDNSLQSIELANRTFASKQITFRGLSEYTPREQFDLVYCNGVFHHIPINQRPSAVKHVYRSLRAEGVFAFWENNPWNPGTRYVMSRIPFDRDAVTLNVLEARRLLQALGFEILRVDFLFVFPRALKWFRFTERFVSMLPLGAQYQILCRKPKL